jgi:hypothetical protein
MSNIQQCTLSRIEQVGIGITFRLIDMGHIASPALSIEKRNGYTEGTNYSYLDLLSIRTVLQIFKKKLGFLK